MTPWSSMASRKKEFDRLSLCWLGHEQTLRSSRGHNTFQNLSSFWTVVLAAILHSRFVRVGPSLGNGKTISVLSWLRFSQSERRCRDSQRTLFLHKSLFKGTRSLDWEYACSVRPGTPPNELFLYECMIWFIGLARHPGALDLLVRLAGFRLVIAHSNTRHNSWLLLSVGSSRHDFAADQASFARERSLVLGRQSAARIGVVSMCHLCRVVQCVLPLGRGKDYLRVVTDGYRAPNLSQKHFNSQVHASRRM